MPNTQHPKGFQGEVIPRCIALLVRLMQGPATKQELVAVIKAYEDPIKPATDKALERKLEEDQVRLKELFGCDLRYDRGEKHYALRGFNRPLIGLPVEALRGLAFLQQTFSEPSAPLSREVMALVNHILRLLPEERQKQVSRERHVLELDLRQRDQDSIADDVWEAVQQASTQHRILEFDYFSPQQSDGLPRHHKVEPQRCFFDAVRCHYYLEAYVLESHGSRGPFSPNKFARYRVGRIVNPRILPDKFVPGSHAPQRDELIYELAPEIARLGVTEHFPNSHIERRPDGSAVVHVMSTNLFLDLRALLHYGPGCRVLGSDKALKEMKMLVSRIAAIYSE